MKIAKYALFTLCSVLMLVGCGGKEEKKKEGFSYEKTKTEPKEAKEEVAAVIDDAEAQKLLTKNTCIACHNKEKKIIGPAFQEIAKRNYSNKRIVELIYKPEPSNWPDYAVPMAPLPNVPRAEAFKLAAWINSLQ